VEKAKVPLTSSFYEADLDRNASSEPQTHFGMDRLAADSENNDDGVDDDRRKTATLHTQARSFGIPSVERGLRNQCQGGGPNGSRISLLGLERHVDASGTAGRFVAAAP
jgi:hypothetical protein